MDLSALMEMAPKAILIADTTAAADTASVSSVSPVVMGIIALIVALVVVGAFVLGRARGQRALEQQKPSPALAPADAPTQRERLTLDRPVEDVEHMSLRELREARGAKLSDAYKSSEEARAQREYRKGAQDPARAAELAVPDEGAAPPAAAASTTPVPAPEAPVVPAPEPSPASLESGLAKTRSSGFIGRLSAIFADKKTLDDSVIEQIEEVLFTADIGTSTSQYLLERIELQIAAGDATVEDVWRMLRAEAASILDESRGELVIGDARPFVVLVVGVNGVGKTTTIGKLAARYQGEGKKVLMVAGDTFRAAAVQQLEEWSKRVGCGFHSGADASDPSGVIFEGIKRAEEEGYDIVLADTAGRLHTRAPLVDELKKIVRVADKALSGAPHETVLVLDSNTGQNAIQQARLFHEAVPLTGLVLTKLDGTAKGGIVLGISRELKLPVYYIGIGEGVRDLRPFQASEFVDALF